MWTFRVLRFDYMQMACSIIIGATVISDSRSRRYVVPKCISIKPQASSIRKSFIETDNSGNCMPIRNCISNGKLAIFFVIESKWHTEARTWRVVRWKIKIKWKRNQLSKAKQSNRTIRKWLWKHLSFIRSFVQIRISLQFSVFDWMLATFLTLRISRTFINMRVITDNNQCNTFSPIPLRKA